MKIKRHQFTVGLDAGVKTGAAVYDAKTKTLAAVCSTDFLGAVEFVQTYEAADCRIVVEIPGAFVYDRHNDRTGKTRDKMNHHIGGNVREAQLLADAIERLGYSVERVPPVKEAKWTAKQLKMILRYTGRTNQHVRDAARLAFYHSGIVTGR